MTVFLALLGAAVFLVGVVTGGVWYHVSLTRRLRGLGLQNPMQPPGDSVEREIRGRK